MKFAMACRSHKAEARTMAPAAPSCKYDMIMMGIVCATVSVFVLVRVTMPAVVGMFFVFVLLAVLCVAVVKHKSRPEG